MVGLLVAIMVFKIKGYNYKQNRHAPRMSLISFVENRHQSNYKYTEDLDAKV